MLSVLRYPISLKSILKETLDWSTTYNNKMRKSRRDFCIYRRLGSTDDAFPETIRLPPVAQRVIYLDTVEAVIEHGVRWGSSSSLQQREHHTDFQSRTDLCLST